MKRPHLTIMMRSLLILCMLFSSMVQAQKLIPAEPTLHITSDLPSEIIFSLSMFRGHYIEHDGNCGGHNKPNFTLYREVPSGWEKVSEHRPGSVMACGIEMKTRKAELSITPRSWDDPSLSPGKYRVDVYIRRKLRGKTRTVHSRPFVVKS